MSLHITPLPESDDSPHNQRLTWLACDASGIPVATAFLRLCAYGRHEHMAEVGVDVHPMRRRRRIGSQLLDVTIAAARAAAQRAVIVQAEASSPGPQFLLARGFRKVHTLRYSRLSLTDLDVAALSKILECPRPGYRLESWHGTAPDDLAESFAASRRVMDDAPTLGVHCGPVTWDANQIRTVARTVEEHGRDLYTVVAIKMTDASIAGYTELVVPADGKGDGQHHGTAVLPEHRGQGLGLWMKAKAITGAYTRYPDLAGLLAETADSDARMRRINEELGYVLTHEALQYQLDF